MQHVTQANTTTAQLRPNPKPISMTQPKSDPNWKPQPCGLSREELRAIVAEIMG